jgi:hypothetical protein
VKRAPPENHVVPADELAARPDQWSATAGGGVEMSEQPELPGLPEAPEVPQAIVWGRWIGHYIVGDPAMIRKNWRPILIAAAVLTAGLWYLTKSRYEDAIGNLTTANTAQQATIAMLQEELKGASPQLAAIQSRRASIRQGLLDRYVQNSKLISTDVWAAGVTKNDAYVADTQKWEAETSDYIQKNLGDAAQARFLATANSTGGATKAQTAWYRMMNLRDTLNTIIESATFDR